jgi:hypothetical protein
MATATSATGANPVIAAINRIVSNGRVRLAMIMGSGLESGWNAAAVGDHGTSFGPFQMHIGGALSASGGTPAQAKNPDWAARAMLGAYTAGVAKVPESMWANDPKNAAALAAYYAERPAQMYPAGRIDSTWNAMRGASYPAGAAPAASTSDSGVQGVTGNPLNPATWIKEARTLVLTAVFVLGGLALVVGGAWQGVAPRLRQTPAGRATGAVA